MTSKEIKEFNDLSKLLRYGTTPPFVDTSLSPYFMKTYYLSDLTSNHILEMAEIIKNNPSAYIDCEGSGSYYCCCSSGYSSINLRFEKTPNQIKEEKEEFEKKNKDYQDNYKKNVARLSILQKKYDKHVIDMKVKNLKSQIEKTEKMNDTPTRAKTLERLNKQLAKLQKV